MQKAMHGILFIILYCGITPGQAGTPGPNKPGWLHLMQNNLDAAEAVFTANTRHDNPDIAGEAFRGLGHVARFKGDITRGIGLFLDAWDKDGSCTTLMAGYNGIVYFREMPEPESVGSDAYARFRRIASRDGIFSGSFKELLLYRYLNDGSMKKARMLTRQLAPLTDWRIIGPFNNISEAGYGTAYPPENEIDFEGTYPGMDGNRVRWNRITVQSPTGWVFSENHCRADDAVLYYYTTIFSDEARDANLAFGASGSFKIFLNGTQVLANPVFRNTGADVFIQQVRLHAGPNTLLLKMCHEKTGQGMSRHSNFLVRFTDPDYGPLPGIRCDADAVPPRSVQQPEPPADQCPTPLTDTVVTLMQQRITADSTDLDAALLLMNFYNIMELTDEGQMLARTYLHRYPNSALWHGLYSESLVRARKQTDSQRELKTAYRCSPAYYDGWTAELNELQSTADARQILAFLNDAPAAYASRPLPLLSSIRANFQLEQKAEGISDLSILEKKHSRSREGMMTMASLWMQQGNAKKALQLIDGYLASRKTDLEASAMGVQITLQQGHFKKAVKRYKEALTYNPDDIDIHYELANMHFMAQKYDAAETYLSRLFRIMPYHPEGLLLQGNIRGIRNDRAGASAAFRTAIEFTRNDFAAWDNLYTLDGKPTPESLVPIDDVEQLIKASAGWPARENPKGAIIDYSTDIMFYPSHCWRKRHSMVCYLPTQKAIDTWKERTVGYNGYFQALNITRALSLKADGSRIPADIDRNQIVFKSLEPGDCTVLEYSLDNYYTGAMANRVWGRNIFTSSYPVYRDRLRLVTPASDTIPYAVYGDSVTVTRQQHDDYAVTVITHPPYRAPAQESFMMTDWPERQQVHYGTIGSWSDIADWYDDLTRHKQRTSLELTSLADSLFTDGLSKREKIARMHHYITGTIRYSSVSFRQSGWVPQSAGDVLATKIGDCKDMACLGKSLLDQAGIPSSLVLVNTVYRHYLDHQMVSPDFNHCILACHLDDGDLFIDLTDNNLGLGTLPKADQGAMALVIRRGNDSLITLPSDRPQDRTYHRAVTAAVGTDGSLTGTLDTRATGWFARNVRGAYRFESDEERKNKMLNFLNGTFTDLEIDSVTVSGMDTRKDTCGYMLRFSARNAASFSGSTVIMPFRFPGRLSSGACPAEQTRQYPLDMSDAWYDISNLYTDGTISYPEDWKVLSMPEAVTIESAFGNYSLEVTDEGGRIRIRRNAQFNIAAPIPVQRYSTLSSFLGRVVRADDMQFVFTRP